jgi:sirohydrochlorin cobaltochelatase
MRRVLLSVAAIAFGCLPRMDAQTAADALLVVAHGSPMGGEWNTRVTRMIGKVEWPGPKGVAFLMTPSEEEKLPRVAARLDQPGVKRIIIVPLLISSFSNHYDEIRYYAGELKHAHVHGGGQPLKTRAPMVVTSAMDSDPRVSRMLADQIRSVSTDPQKETLVLLTHGPNEEDNHEKWVACLKVHGAYLQKALGFKRVEYATLRDDAPKPVKDAAIAHLREVVKASAADSTVVIQPVLISVGQVQAEIQELLAGMRYKMSESGIANHPLTLEWIHQQAVAKAR